MGVVVVIACSARPSVLRRISGSTSASRARLAAEYLPSFSLIGGRPAPGQQLEPAGDGVGLQRLAMLAAEDQVISMTEIWGLYDRWCRGTAGSTATRSTTPWNASRES
jgi:hypothetical protein